MEEETMHIVRAWSLILHDFEIQAKFEQGSKTEGIERLTKRVGTATSFHNNPSFNASIMHNIQRY